MCHYALAPGGVWQQLALFGTSNLNNAPCMIEGQFGATAELDFGNFELCVAHDGEIQHWFRDNHGSQAWYQTATFGQGITRVVALLESSFGFDLEVIAQTFDGHHQHFWRDASGWNTGVTIN